MWRSRRSRPPRLRDVSASGSSRCPEGTRTTPANLSATTSDKDSAMRCRRPLLLAAILLLPFMPTLARADEARLRCIADTNVSSYPSERAFNYGRTSRLRLKGIEMMALMRFDLGPAKGLRIERAELFLRYASPDRKLRTIGFST